MKFVSALFRVMLVAGLAALPLACDDVDECIPLCLPRFRHLSLFAGVHAFKGPRDNGFANNFGFQQGFAAFTMQSH